jgi:two-component system LytT family response regulator
MAALLPASTRIVFTTAYSEYAAESYSFQTIDYLLKPITLKRFYAALQKIEAFFARPGQQPEPTGPSEPLTANSEEDYFFIKSGRMLYKVLLKDILYFEGEKEYARVVTRDQKLLIYRRLKDIEEQLSPSFTRIHNSYIVNLARLDAIKDNHVFIGTKQIPISEKFREVFMNRIKLRVF